MTNYFEEATFYFEETDRIDNETGDYSGQAITCAILALVQEQQALVQEQRRTNELLAAALQMAKHAIRYGDLLGLDLDAALDNFTTHPRESWPGPCGTTETPND